MKWIRPKTTSCDFCLYLSDMLQMQVKNIFHSTPYKEDESLKRTNDGKNKAKACKVVPKEISWWNWNQKVFVVKQLAKVQFSIILHARVITKINDIVTATDH